jgi:hypothetical protein
MRLIKVPALRRATLAALLAPLVAAALTATAAPGGSPAARYRPLEFLVGHCWKGTFPDSQVTDQHCFSWIYGGKFVRDQHVVHHGGGKPDDFGESIYLWDASSQQLQYLYIESAGGYSRGTVSAEGDALVFPAATYTENGRAQTYRSRWHHAAPDAYDVVTEFQDQDRWVPGFTVHMKQVGD